MEFALQICKTSVIEDFPLLYMVKTHSNYTTTLTACTLEFAHAAQKF